MLLHIFPIFIECKITVAIKSFCTYSAMSFLAPREIPCTLHPEQYRTFCLIQKAVTSNDVNGTNIANLLSFPKSKITVLYLYSCTSTIQLMSIEQKSANLLSHPKSTSTGTGTGTCIAGLLSMQKTKTPSSSKTTLESNLSLVHSKNTDKQFFFDFEIYNGPTLGIINGSNFKLLESQLSEEIETSRSSKVEYASANAFIH